jgi:hypothetical protein
VAAARAKAEELRAEIGDPLMLGTSVVVDADGEFATITPAGTEKQAG